MDLQINGMILPPDEDTESCIFAPRILKIYPATEASSFFNGEGGNKSTCLDIIAGDGPDTLMHAAIGIKPGEARSLMENARISHRPLVFWFGRPMPWCVHIETGKPIFIGFLDRLGTRGPATQ